MININDKKLTIESTLREAFKIINNGPAQLGVVVDRNSKLIGTVTDGDLRRAILSGKSLDSDIQGVFNNSPISVSVNDVKENIINICTPKKIHQVPVIDSDGRVIGIDILDELILSKHYKNTVVLMVGGLGTRLRPLTEDMPKPMLPVGGKPILQTILEKFISYGYSNIIMCVGYKSEVIKNYFGDGSKFGANIEYIMERKQMGTIGALSLLAKNQAPNSPFFVMNGDLLTNVNFKHMMDFHIANKGKATMCIREHDVQLPYGEVEICNDKISSIKEKPIHSFFINAGIYILEPECLKLIPTSKSYDIPSLFKKILTNGEKITPFPLQEYWIDIGHIREYERANLEYVNVFDK